MVILDFSKAFDTVPRQQLLHKMRQKGVDGNITAWLCNFLTNRKMRVVINGEESEAVPVDYEVRPGTVLGPLLFLCHINDLLDAVKSTVRLFADDCLLCRQIKSREDHIPPQHDLQNLETWAKALEKRFNAKKCYIMCINFNSNALANATRRLIG